MTDARQWHTASILANGKVLVTGDRNGISLNTAELYDPATGNWTTTGNMTNARHWHTATVLANGKVLVTGGLNGASYLNTAEVYDSATGSWTTTGNMTGARNSHTASVLANGRVLVTGGSNGVYLNTAELFPRLKGGSYKIKVCLFVCLFVCLSVTGSKEHCREGHELRNVLKLSGVIRYGEFESGVI